MKAIQKESDVHILIVDDEEDFRELLAEIISHSGYVVHTAANGFEAVNLFQEIDIDVVLVDFLMPQMNGLELMRQLKQIDRDVAVIFITGQGSIESAVNAMKQGAYDYITKPIQFEEVENLISRLIENRRLISENRLLKKLLRQKYNFKNIIANSPCMIDVVKKIELASQNKVPVLIQGETGTGKELFARTIHFNSSRASKTFMPQDCSALSDDLLIDEWIGREFTLKQKSYAKKGIFRLANRGTVFLKELSSLSKKAQKRLYQILHSNQIYPKGSNSAFCIDIRIISASKNELSVLVKKGSFDPALFQLLHAIQIDLPPLTERKEDIPVLLNHFLAEKNLNNAVHFRSETLNILKAYSWPQNIFELKNVFESLLSIQNKGEILPKHLPDYLVNGLAPPISSKQKSLKEAEKEAIQNALSFCQGNTRQTAKILKISVSSLYRKIKKYQL